MFESAISTARQDALGNGTGAPPFLPHQRPQSHAYHPHVVCMYVSRSPRLASQRPEARDSNETHALEPCHPLVVPLHLSAKPRSMFTSVRLNRQMLPHPFLAVVTTALVGPRPPSSRHGTIASSCRTSARSGTSPCLALSCPRPTSLPCFLASQPALSTHAAGSVWRAAYLTQHSRMWQNIDPPLSCDRITG